MVGVRLRPSPRARRGPRIIQNAMLRMDLIRSAFRAALRNGADIVIGSDFGFALCGLVVGFLLRRPLIYDSHGNRRDLCEELRLSLLRRVFGLAMEKMLVTCSNVVFVVSDYDRQSYVRMGAPSEKLYCVPTGANLVAADEALRRVDRSTFRSKVMTDSGKKMLLFSAISLTSPTMLPLST